MYDPPVNISDKRWYKRIINALPAFMNQSPESNNQKILGLFSIYGNAYKNDELDMTDQTLVQHASGKMLDRLCADWGVNIIDESDDEFKKFQIRFQMLRHRLGPGTNDIKDAISFLFNIPENAFDIVSTGIKAIKVTNLPFNFDTGDKTELKHELIAKYIRGMLPPEYELKDVEYEASTDIWLYQGIQTPQEPIYEFATQYISPLEIDISSFVEYHTVKYRQYNVSQQFPTVRENIDSTFGAYHASRFHITRAMQKERTVISNNTGWLHSSFHANRFNITNVTQNRKD